MYWITLLHWFEPIIEFIINSDSTPCDSLKLVVPFCEWLDIIIPGFNVVTIFDTPQWLCLMITTAAFYKSPLTIIM